MNNLGRGRERGFAVVPLVGLLGLVLLLAISAYFPFNWDPPRIVRNDVTRTAGGSLRFGDMNAARTAGTPAWLQGVRQTGAVQIRLVADPGGPAGQSASIMMLASDFLHTDFAIGQDHANLDVWLRRPGSDPNGGPPFVVGAVFRPRHRTIVQVTLKAGELRIDVGGRPRLTRRLPPDSTGTWRRARIALGDEVHGGGPWQGEIRHAEVRAAGHAVDYVRPGALSIPVHYLYLPDHIAPFPPPSLREWLILLLHFLTFIPVGFLIASARRPPVRPVPAMLLATGIALVLAAGKFLFHARHAAVADIVVQGSGALLGAFLASRLARRPPAAAGTTRAAG